MPEEIVPEEWAPGATRPTYKLTLRSRVAIVGKRRVATPTEEPSGPTLPDATSSTSHSEQQAAHSGLGPEGFMHP